MNFLGRAYETDLIKKAIASPRAELGVVYGRRRVGKSTLLAKFIRPEVDLLFEGLEGQGFHIQVSHFLDQFAAQTKTMPIRATTWKEAFEAITPVLLNGKRCVVFDEFPWMAGEKNELVALLKFYWDTQWKKNSKLTLILCGSVASFMVRHVLHSHALHNRKTFELKIEPLSAKEASSFFKNFRSPFEIAQFLCIFGGVPKYLEQLDVKKSLYSNLDRLCFMRGGFFVNEFETLFKEQFRVIRNYERIVRELAKASLSKEGVAHCLNLQPGGGLGTYLQNLESAGFIRRESPLSLSLGSRDSLTSRSKTLRYSIWDEWLRFYFSFMDTRMKVIQTNTRQGLAEGIMGRRLEPYLGIAFERLCQKNITQIYDALEIEPHRILDVGPFFRQPSRKNKSKTGVQIDLLIRQKANTLTLVECKFTQDPVGKSIIHSIDSKIKALKAPKNMSIERVLISASGATPELEDSEYFHKILGLEAVL